MRIKKGLGLFYLSIVFGTCVNTGLARSQPLSLAASKSKAAKSTATLKNSTFRPHQQVKTLKGKVSDERGKPLPGVTIRVVSTGVQAITDGSGNFSIRATEGDYLTFTMLGYETLIQQVGSSLEYTIEMTPISTAIEEVTVNIGYGTVDKSDLTGSVAQVNMEDLSKAPVASFDEALAGRVAGVQVSANEGQPGTEMNIVIRGGNSLTQSNDPLYVIDGFPIEDPGAAVINPGDIESISILKDASATAIYGSRGANGVVIIESKKGQIGRPVIRYDGSIGFQQVTNKMEMMSPYDFVKYQLEMNPEVSPIVYLTRPGRTLEDYRNLPGVNWQDLMFRQSPMHNHNLSVTGGTKETRYRIAASLFDREGIVVNSGYGRAQARIGLDQTVTNKLTVGLQFNYSRDKNYGSLSSASQGVSTGYSTYMLYRIWGYRPITGVGSAADLVDEIMDDEGLVSFADARVNPVMSAENEIREQSRNTLIGNAYVKYKITDDLELDIRGGVNSRWVKDEEFYNSRTARGYPSLSNFKGVNGIFGQVERTDWMNENTLTYKKRTANKRHSINAVVGMTMQARDQSRYGYEAYELLNENLGLSGMDNGEPGPLDALHTGHTLVSFLTRGNYSYRSKYLVTATFRADGSSKFSPQNRWGYFPSMGLAWRISREKFMKSLPLFSDAKFRFSYGETGNNRIGDFVRFSSLSTDYPRYYPFNNTPTASVNTNRFGNENLRWETTKQTDIGLDLALFKNKLNLTVDVYRKNTHDLLLNANVPYSSGYSTIYKNIGLIRNEGLEISLSTTNLKKKHFIWTTDFNISFNRNKVLGLTDDEEQILSDVSWTSTYNSQPLYMAKLGGSAASFIGYVWDGVYQYSDFNVLLNGTYVLKNGVPTNGLDREAIQPGDMKYVDINDDGIMNEQDIVEIGRGIPVHIGGFNNNFSYKGFSLNVFFQWSYGNDIFNTNRIMFEGNSEGRGHLNQYASYVDRWSPDNQDSRNYRAGGQGPRGVYSSKYVEDGSYLRLKTVALSYNLSQSLVGKLKMNGLELYASAQNLYTWTNYSGMDPEVSVRHSTLTPGFDYSAYPMAKTLVFGVKAKF
ncbi:TonB-dependent receptor [Sphingobacterium sp. SGG-5]|nr:TonB-dependent receptor [Sphingobacterium sp. SGG-5]